MAIVFLGSSLVTAQSKNEEVIATNIDSGVERVPVQSLPIMLPRRILEYRLLGNFETTRTILYQSDSIIGHYIKVHITAYQPGDELTQFAQMSLDMLENQCDRAIVGRKVFVPDPWKADLASPVEEASQDCSILFHAETDGYHICIEMPQEESIDRVEAILGMVKLIPPVQIDPFDSFGFRFTPPKEFGDSWKDKSSLGGFVFETDDCSFQLLKFSFTEKEREESIAYMKSIKNRSKDFFYADSLSLERCFLIEKCSSDVGDPKVYCSADGLITSPKGSVVVVVSFCTLESLEGIMQMVKDIEILD
jgi:hypothetical protein